MKLTYGGKIQVKERKGEFKGPNQRLIWAFVNSGEPCALIDGWKHKSAYTCRWSFTASVKSMNLPQVYVLAHRGKVYLINTQL